MNLRSVSLENYRGHANFSLDLNPGFNVIVGINGSGKTSVLKAISDVLTGFTSFINMLNFHYQPFTDSNVVRLKGEVFDGRYRFEPQFPISVGATASAFGMSEGFSWTITKTSQTTHHLQTGMSPGQIWQKNHASGHQFGQLYPNADILPVLAFYRANRNWNQAQPHEMQAALSKNSRTDGYNSWVDASLDASALQGWVISKCLERFQVSSETGQKFESITSDELAHVNNALTSAVEGIKGLKYDLRQKSLLVEWVEASDGSIREPTAFGNLSDGQRAVIGLVTDIARRMCVLNPQLDQDVMRRTGGVVLIDELDMHLHPRWQRILTSGLKRAFPAVQFIVASHSPQVIGELHPDEIILLRNNSTSHPQVSYGLTSSQVLEEIMGADARSPVVQEMLSDAFELLERGDAQNAKLKLVELEEESPGLPELAGAWALLRRKEILGR